MNELVSGLRQTLCVVAVLIVSACSDAPGGGGIDGTGKVQPIVGSGFIIGQVESVDNLVIDGHEYQAALPMVLINGEEGALSDLRVGMSVTADVNKEQRTISRIEYQSIVAGPIEQALVEENALIVLGQEILISNDTYLDSLTPEDLFEGEIIEVGGGRGSDNSIVAEYIRAYANTEKYFVVGQLDNSPADEEQISVSGTQIDFKPVIEDSSSDQISEFVAGATIVAEVKIGDASPDEPQLTASNAEVLGNIETDRYETVEISGVVTKVSENDTFVIRKIVFRLNSETEYLNRQGDPTDPVAIMASSKLKVEALTLNDGTVLATRITVRN